MGFKHKTFAARADHFLQTYTPRYICTHMQVEEVGSFTWPADDVDPSVTTIQMSKDEARTFLAMLRDDIEDKHIASEKEADRRHEIELARAKAIHPTGTSPPLTPVAVAPTSSFEGDELEERKLAKALEIHDACRKEGHIGCNSETVRKMVTSDAQHPFNKFMERRKITFDSMTTAEQSLMMRPPFAVSDLPVAAQDWLRTAYAVKCSHLELTFIQAEIFRMSKHISTIASIKESIDTRKPRFIREEQEKREKKVKS